MAAAMELEKEGINAEVIDLRTVRPIDYHTVIESVKKTNRLVVVEEAPVESSSKRSDTRAGSSKGMGATTPPLPGAGVRWRRLVSAHGGSLGAHVEEHATRHGLGGGDAACVGSSSMK